MISLKHGEDGMKDINLKPTHDDIHQACKNLSEQVRYSNFKPNFIVGLTRGGLPLAVIISHMLDNIQVIPINYSSKKGKGDNTNHANFLPRIFLNDEIPRLIIIDDICDSGQTLKEVSEYYKKCGHDVRTLVIHYKEFPVPLIVPDFYEVTITANSPWVVYPWEKSVDF